MTHTVAWASAYNAVSSNKTLSDSVPAALPPSSITPAAAPKTKPKSEFPWTKASQKYALRAVASFENLPAGLTPQECKDKLREIIQINSKSLDTVDWSSLDLPHEIILKEREAKNSQAKENGISNYVNPSNGPTNPQAPPSASKRKSLDLDGLQSSSSPAKSSIPPWLKTNSLVDRVSFTNGSKDKRQKKNAPAAAGPSKLDSADLEKRKQRFQLGTAGIKATPPCNSPQNDSDSDESDAPLVGTNQCLEKAYLRLTARPKAEDVRPQYVLEKTLELLRHKWRTERNYNYICNQFKSVRQDLTVQHIKNSFTVRVYENHARIALEMGDLGEYNQCQTQLRALYRKNLGGNPAEFLAYRILYFVYTCNKADMNALLAELTTADKNQPWVKHALAVRSSLALGNYHKFFKLYIEAENMGSYLMDMFLERERLRALAYISKAYKFVSLRFLTNELSFTNDDECHAFFETHKVHHLIEKHMDATMATHDRVNFKGGVALVDQLCKNAFSKIDIKGQI